MDFSAFCKVENERIICQVNATDVNEFTEYAYYLYDMNRNIADKQMYTKENEASFVPLKPGKYYVRAFVRWKDMEEDDYHKNVKNSNSVIVLDSAIDEEYQQFVKSTRQKLDFEFPFCKTEAPYQDFCLVSAKQPDESVLGKIQILSDNLALNYNVLSTGPRVTSVMTGEALYKENSHSVAFSGIGRTADRLVFGMKDVRDLVTADVLSEQTGTFWMLRADPEKILLESDYFGISKIFYFRTDALFLASNRIHLILLALKKLGVVKTINWPKIYASIFVNNSLMMQNFSREMDIKGLFMLPADTKIRIDLRNNRIELEKTELYNSLATPLDYDEQTYWSLLQKAKDELIDNARVALEYPEFKHFMVHITGGLDSRIVYSALTLFPQYNDKIVAHTVKQADNIKDYETAMKVVSKHRFSPGPIPRDEFYSSSVDCDLRGLSCVLGATTEYPRFEGFPYQNTCIFPGFFGGILGREVYARLLYETPLDDSSLSDEDFYTKLTERYKPYMIADVSEEVYSILSQECMKLPGRNNLEKFENHYLFYRNGLHFNDSWSVQISAPSWGILQSKTMFRLKCMIAPLRYGIKLQLDMLYLLNPNIASVELESEKNTIDRNKLHDQFGCYPEVREYDEKAIRSVIEDWEDNQAYIRSFSRPSKSAKLDIYEEQKALDVLHTLINTFSLDQNYGKEIYKYLRYDSNDREKLWFYRKLYSVYFELTV